MGLGSRNARRHETQVTAGVNPEDYWDFKPGQDVMTVDGFLGKVTAVHDGPVGGSEVYEVLLVNGLGGGAYTASQLRASQTNTASAAVNTASLDYPELDGVLQERLDPGRYPDHGLFSMSSLQVEANGVEDLYHSFTPLQADGSNTQQVASEIRSWYDGLNAQANQTVCQNGHLQWDGQCASCRNTPVGDGPMVVNEGDNKPNTQVTAGMHGVPLHQPGDRVVSFRGEGATIHSVRDSGHPGKSNKVQVVWDDADEKERAHAPYSTEYNESVFDPHPDAPPEQIARYHQRKADNKAASDLLDSIESEHSNVVWPHQAMHLLAVSEEDRAEIERIKASHRKQADYWDMCEEDEDGHCHYHNTDHGHSQDFYDQRAIDPGHDPYDHATRHEMAHGGFPPVAHGPTPEEMAQEHIRRQFNEEDPPNNNDGCTICGDSEHNNSGHVDDMLRDQIDNSFKDVHPFTRAEHARQPGKPSFYSKMQRQVEHGYALIRQAVSDPDFQFHITAAWRDVRNKAKRIRTDGGVHITTVQNGYLIAQVRGDHGTYESVIMRAPGTQKVAQWDCGCTWAKYHWGAPDDFSRFSGRMCSHVLALNFEAQSRGMFGREIHQDTGAPAWLKKRDMALTSAREDGQWPDCGPIHVFAASALLLGEDPVDIGLLLSTVATITASVNSPFGEPGPNPVPGIVNGATSPRREENPASAGFLTAADPDSWGANRLPSGMDSKLSSLDDAIFEPEPIEVQSSFDPHLAFLPLLIPIAEAIGVGGGAAAAEGGAAAAGEAGAAAGAGEAAGGAGAEAGGGGGMSGLMSRLPKMPKLPGMGEGGNKVLQQANDFAQHVKNFTDRDKNEGEAVRQSMTGSHSTLHDEPEPALPSTDGAEGDVVGPVDDYPADQTWSGYAGDPDPDPMPHSGSVDTGVNYLMPGDSGSSGGGLDPDTNFKTDPTSLEPEDPSFVSTGAKSGVQYGGSTVDDIVAQFQSGGGGGLGGSSDGGAGRYQASVKANSDIAAGAKAFLEGGMEGLTRTAMAVFTPAQQQELINEGEHTGARARNLDGLQIEGTHYEALEVALGADDEDTWLD